MDSRPHNVIRRTPTLAPGEITDPPAGWVTEPYQENGRWVWRDSAGVHDLATEIISDAGSIVSYDAWTGTQAEYDALGAYDALTLYLIAG